MVVPLGIGPTMNARTDGPMDTVANDAWAGTSSGIAMVCTPVGSSSSSITREVLFGSGANEVCHQAIPSKRHRIVCPLAVGSCMTGTAVWRRKSS
jgi:hypothetical protein